MRKTYLHVGMPKTGSTSIQSYFTDNREKLLGDGVCYLSSLGKYNQKALVFYAQDIETKMEKDIRTHFPKLELKVGMDSESVRKEIKDRFVDEVSDLYPSVHTLVLSCESLFRLSAPEMIRLRDLIFPIGGEYKIVLYIREQVDYIISNYTMRVRRGDKRSFSEYVNQKSRDKYIDYEYLIDLWEKNFGYENIIVRTFDRNTLVDGDVVADFLSATNISPSFSNTQPTRRNPSLDAGILAQVRAINCQFTNKQALQALESFRTMQKLLVREDFSGRRILMPEADAQSIRAQFAPSNERVRARYFPDRQSLFSSKSKSEDVLDQEDISLLSRTDFLESFLRDLLRQRLRLERK